MRGQQPSSNRKSGKGNAGKDATGRVSRVYGIAGKGNTEKIMSRLRGRE